MKKTLILILTSLLTITLHSQTATLGNLRTSSRIVTNETDTTALSALSTTSTTFRAQLTNEALYRATADNAFTASLSSLSNRTLTINGQAGTLSSNLSYTIAGGVTSVNSQTGAVSLTASDLSAVPTTRTLTINGQAGTLSSNLSYTIAGGVTSVNSQTGAVSLTYSDVNAIPEAPFNPPHMYARGMNNWVMLPTSIMDKPITWAYDAYGIEIDWMVYQNKARYRLDYMSIQTVTPETLETQNQDWNKIYLSATNLIYTDTNDISYTYDYPRQSGTLALSSITNSFPTYSSITNIITDNQQFNASLYGWGSLTQNVNGISILTLSNAIPTSSFVTYTNSTATNNGYAATFITATNQRITRISEGTGTIKFHAAKGASGTITTKPEFYITDANGNTIAEYNTGSATPQLSTSDSQYSCDISFPSNIIITSSQRIKIAFKLTTSTGTHTVYISSQGDRNLILTLPVPSALFATTAELEQTKSTITQESNAKFFSTVPGWYWQGSQQVTTNTITTNLTGLAEYTNTTEIALVPLYTNYVAGTGSVILTSSRYIVGVSYDVIVPAVGLLPIKPMNWEHERLSPTSYVIRAFISTSPIDQTPPYFLRLTNLVCYGYDRTEMINQHTYTNDAAGILARCDDADGSDPRQLINFTTLSNYISRQSSQIAKEAWNYTPSGARVPSSSLCVIDEPLIQQGSITYLQSGDYFIQSYAGGEWVSTPTGSVWRIGPSGRTAFEIAASNKLLNVIAFNISGGYATIDISTNGVLTTPSIEYTESLTNAYWLSCPLQNMSNGVSFWRGTCPAPSGSRFFRAVDPSGFNLLTSKYPHRFDQGLSAAGSSTITNLTVLNTFSSTFIDPVHSVYNLSNLFNNGTCTITRALGSYVGIDCWTNVTLEADVNSFSSDKVSTFSLCLRPNTYAVTFGTGLSNTLSITSNSTNGLIFIKHCGWSKFIGKGSPAP